MLPHPSTCYIICTPHKCLVFKNFEVLFLHSVERNLIRTMNWQVFTQWHCLNLSFHLIVIVFKSYVTFALHFNKFKGFSVWINFCTFFLYWRLPALSFNQGPTLITSRPLVHVCEECGSNDQRESVIELFAD